MKELKELFDYTPSNGNNFACWTMKAYTDIYIIDRGEFAFEESDGVFARYDVRGWNPTEHHTHYMSTHHSLDEAMTLALHQFQKYFPRKESLCYQQN
mgnify:CR=1 FL=1|jgi:hypothetical protein